MSPALQEKSGSLPMTEYRGASTVATFGDTPAEFAALRSGCGVYHLAWRARVALTGSDRVRWLNGMVTNNIRDLEVGRGIYAFLLNPQGRILGDLYAYNRGESILVDTDRSQLDKILASFEHYIIMDDVEVANLGEQLAAIGITGPKSGSVLRAAEIQVPQLQPLQIAAAELAGGAGRVECTIVRGEDTQLESYEIWLPSDRVKPVWEDLLKAGATPVGSGAIELQRIARGIPRYGQDIRERDLPQETEQDRALNFNKGCYVGQEIVERIRSRGNVHRKFTGFKLQESSTPPAPGTKIAVDGKAVGEVTSAAVLPSGNGGKAVALGYIRREAGTPGRQVHVGASSAVVASLPFADV